MRRPAPIVVLAGILFAVFCVAGWGIGSTRTAAADVDDIALDPPRPLVTEIRPVFFPPTTPVFGRPIRELPFMKKFNGKSYPAPVELADDVGEFFYPPLSSRRY
jgi:hypothetical protein